MSELFAELDYRITPIGALSLRRRRELSSGADIFEIKLGDEYLMSSQFTVSEIALARLGLAVLQGGQLDVVVGGLGLGFTARAVLENENVKSLMVYFVQHTDCGSGGWRFEPTQLYHLQSVPCYAALDTSFRMASTVGTRFTSSKAS